MREGRREGRRKCQFRMWLSPPPLPGKRQQQREGQALQRLHLPDVDGWTPAGLPLLVGERRGMASTEGASPEVALRWLQRLPCSRRVGQW